MSHKISLFSRQIYTYFATWVLKSGGKKKLEMLDGVREDDFDRGWEILHINRVILVPDVTRYLFN